MSSDVLFRILSGFAVMIITFSVKHRSHCLQMLIVITAVYSGSVATCLSVDNLLFLDSTKRSMAYNPWMQVWSVNCEICKNGLVLCSWFF